MPEEFSTIRQRIFQYTSNRHKQLESRGKQGFSTGEFLRVTPEHRFYCNGSWVEARNLQPGDLLSLKNGDYTCIASIELFPHYEKVYNFDIKDNENYYVTEDGILVHNGYTPKAKVTKVDGQAHSIEVSISKSDYPETGKHIEDAIAAGKPSVVTIARDASKSNRAKSLRGVKPKQNLDRDEWPMAMFKEGGSGASVRHINPSDNRGAGSAIGNALSEYPDGTVVKIIITK
ncbi:polymorphic toxin-type HINT domain-containing protein [Porphyromonas macacae]|uniref:polymorphic toxin-type HINT domain-containing protein n=1 Tax=Porphyromonas macacae TaxID=28115 RepID=UPI00293530CB|nr:polymorphic toxin-type HINT domain-containing protein [Porphyromonas macacae]